VWVATTSLPFVVFFLLTDFMRYFG